MFFTIEHRIRMTYFIDPLSVGKGSNFCFETPDISGTFVCKSFLDKEESFPLEVGRIAGNSSTFFNEFFLISVGLFYILDASFSIVLANDSKF